MAFRIGNRVTSTIGILLILFFVTSSVSHLLTQRVRDDVILLFYGSEEQAEITILRSALQSLSEALDKQGETLDRAGGSPQKRDALRAIDKLIAENAGTIEAYLEAEIPPAFESPRPLKTPRPLRNPWRVRTHSRAPYPLTLSELSQSCLSTGTLRRTIGRGKKLSVFLRSTWHQCGRTAHWQTYAAQT